MRRTYLYKAVGSIAFVLAFSGMAEAREVICVADTQCRGDAQRMCAPSTLRIAARQSAGAGTQLWIDRQGPYSAHVSQNGDARSYALKTFGGLYTLDIEADGRFLYVGNRGKRFTGSCEDRT